MDGGFVAGLVCLVVAVVIGAAMLWKEHKRNKR
jgi:hypothetical protein